MRSSRKARDSISNASKKILIIGGAGNMGQWFVQFFNSMGIEVTIFDPHSDQSRWTRLDQIKRELLDSFHYILLATPIYLCSYHRPIM